MQTVINTVFGQVKIGQIFVMYDILMIKTDVSASVAIGHLDFIGFHLDYRDDLISRGLIPFKIEFGVLVSIIQFTDQDFDGEFKINHFGGIPNMKTFDPIFMIKGQPYVMVDDEDGIFTLLNLYDILEIENVGDFGVLDSPNTLFVRDRGLLTNWLYLAKD